MPLPLGGIGGDLGGKLHTALHISWFVSISHFLDWVSRRGVKFESSTVIPQVSLNTGRSSVLLSLCTAPISSMSSSSISSPLSCYLNYFLFSIISYMIIYCMLPVTYPSKSSSLQSDSTSSIISKTSSTL